MVCSDTELQSTSKYNPLSDVSQTDLVTIPFMISLLIAIVITMVIAIGTILILRAAHAQALLNGHLLPP